jgi:hypothetical protein
LAWGAKTTYEGVIGKTKVGESFRKEIWDRGLGIVDGRLSMISELFGMLAACQIAVNECDEIVTCTVRRFLIFFSCGSRQRNNRREKTPQLETAG